jgi:hypothetical protein
MSPAKELNRDIARAAILIGANKMSAKMPNQMRFAIRNTVAERKMECSRPTRQIAKLCAVLFRCRQARKVSLSIVELLARFNAIFPTEFKV